MNIPFDPSPNYRKGRRGPGISHIVIHTMQGTFSGSRQWFKNFKSQVSAHYLISKKGDIVQMVKEEDTAWHVCNANPFTIGIELEDYGKGPRDVKTGRVQELTSQNDPAWFTQIQLDTAAEIVADICHRRAINVAHIIGHNSPMLKEYGNNHQDPGPYFPWDKFRKMVQVKLGGVNSALAGVASA